MKSSMQGVLDVEDLTQKDNAFDVMLEVDGKRIGIGLKTWIHTRDRTYQKVAEFNKLALSEINPLIRDGNFEEEIRKGAPFRNKRIMLDKRLYDTSDDIYHFITRDDGIMNIVETTYDPIDLNNIDLKKGNGRTISFSDGPKNYKYYAGKSVLMEEFDASDDHVIFKIPIEHFEDPFRLISLISLDKDLINETIEENVYKYEENTICLPIYSDQSHKVEEVSAFNAQLGASKYIRGMDTKGYFWVKSIRKIDYGNVR